MTDHHLGADLYQLYVMATENLPDVAAVYDRAGNMVEYTGSAQIQFSRHPQFGGPYGPTHQPWVELRDTVREFLGDTAANLRATADALLLATETFASADREAQDEMNRLKRQHEPV